MNPVYPIKAVVAPQKPQFSISLTASFLRWGEVGKHKKNATKRNKKLLSLPLPRFDEVRLYMHIPAGIAG
jgi:hypothetical protein